MEPTGWVCMLCQGLSNAPHACPRCGKPRREGGSLRAAIDDVRRFMWLGSPGVAAPAPVIPPLERRRLCRILIDGEVNAELLPALRGNDLVEIADGIADAIYVLIWTALEYGIPLARIWDAVQATNLAKVEPGPVVRDIHGKILKPQGWVPPDIEGILRQAGWKP